MTSRNNIPDDVLIVGGGTAGWLTAAYLARRLGGPGGMRITLLESADIGSIGVGEGTFPTIARTLALLGADEAQFMRESSAAFKQGIRFVDWQHAPPAHPDMGARRRHYYHPFALPRQAGIDLLPHWLAGEAGAIPFAAAVTLQEDVCEAGRAPKRDSDAGFHGPMNYAYHLDAVRFGRYLSSIAKELGVVHRLGTVQEVDLDESGAIAGVITREHGTLTAGLYIDCTGFRAELIGRALGVPFQNKNAVLFVDRAVAMQVPHADQEVPIPPYTISTAHEAGWSWDIALPQRRGVGYVYSSAHTDGTRAEAVLRAHVGAAANELAVRHLELQIGWRTQHFVKNCVAVGLSGGFLEPLESTGIILIEAAAWLLADLCGPGADLAAAARTFNQHMAKRYERIVDFIKMHYFLTQRTDSEFWRDNARVSTATDSLQAHLETWRTRPPAAMDFTLDYETFAPANYQFVLYGMGFKTRPPAHRATHTQDETAHARREFARIRDAARRAVAALPTHRKLLQRVNQAGFSFAESASRPLRPMLVR